MSDISGIGPREEPKPMPALKRFYVVATFQADDGKFNGSLSKIHRWIDLPDRHTLEATLLEDARAELKRFGRANAEPSNLQVYLPPMELPEPPTPPANDRRPSRNWKVSAYMAVHDIHFAQDLRGEFSWPEPPSGETLKRMIYCLMCDALISRGDHPGQAEGAEVGPTTVEPAGEA